MEQRTTKPEYAPFILSVLKHLRTTNREELFEETFTAMEHRLHSADHAILANNEPRWRNQAQHMLDGMIEDGIINEIEGVLSIAES